MKMELSFRYRIYKKNKRALYVTETNGTRDNTQRCKLKNTTATFAVGSIIPFPVDFHS
jgi:hypothetical protein